MSALQVDDSHARHATEPRTVLIVDDFPAVLAWASRAFQRDGWIVKACADGMHALSTWRELHDAGQVVSLLVTDLDLPDLDGASLARALRALDEQLPIIALKGAGTTNDGWPGSVLNRTVFFTKPVRATELVLAAHALLGGTVELCDDSLSPAEPSGPFDIIAA